jgi:cobalt-zinc-cadmium efflux system protein
MANETGTKKGADAGTGDERSSGHTRGRSEHVHDHSAVPGRRLFLAVLINIGITVAELIAGMMTGSLALLSDAAHNFSDVLALALAYAGSKMTERSPSEKHTYGLGRAEVLAGMINALALVGITGVIFYEAYQRLLAPQPLPGGVMLGIGAFGLVGNVASVLVLTGRKRKRHSLNIRSAILHLSLDALSAVGVMIAAVIVMATGWARIDSVVSILIGVLVLVGSVGLIREGVHIVMEAVPPGITLEEVSKVVRDIEGVRDVHDLHVWAVSSTYTVMSAHVVLDSEGASRQNEVLADVRKRVSDEFDVHHFTLQPEREECDETSGVCYRVPIRKPHKHDEKREREVKPGHE